LLHVAPVWSAFGASIAPVSHVHQRWETHTLPADHVAVNTIFDQLEREAHETLSAEGFPGSTHTLTRALRCRYNAQFYDVEVSVPSGALGTTELELLQSDFERIYDELHGEGAGYREGGAQITSFTVRASARTDEPQIAAQSLSVDARWNERPVFWSEIGSFAPTPVLTISNGVLDERLHGPMLVELPDTVVVIRPGQTAEFDRLGSLMINVTGGEVP
jgi:N-methylhydantoinase A